MSEGKRMGLKLLSTGVPGLDQVLGGGLPEYSFNLVAGVPGAGKTTLVHQITFANASAERRALHFTVLGEPPLKMLRYQQQMGFFEPDKVGDLIKFVDLSAEVLGGDLGKLLARMVEEVEQVLTVVKMRRSGHRQELYSYEITPKGMRVGEPLLDYEGILTGVPRARPRAERTSTPGLSREERLVLDALSSLGEADVQALVEASGVQGDALTRELTRLVGLSYAVEEAGGARYRLASRRLGG